MLSVDSEDNILTDEDSVRRFFGCHMGRMLCGFPSIRDTWSTRDSLFAIDSVKDSMPRGACFDMYRCMHFADDWDEDEGVE